MSTTDGIVVSTASATPYLCVHDAAAAIDFYVAAFGAVETMRLPQPAPDTRLGHAEVTVGGARIMLSDEFPELGVLSPRTLGGSPLMLHVVFDDVDIDAVFARAEAAGAAIVRPPSDQFYGERAGQVVDPFGHRWTLATTIEEVTAGEVVRRAAEGAGSAAEEAEGAEGAEATVDLGQRAEITSPDTRDGDLGYLTVDVPDLERAKAFFGTLLGWRFAADAGTSDPGGAYAHVDDVTPPVGLVGAAPEPRPTLYFRVGDIRAAVARTEELGGSADEPAPSPSGWSAACTDDQGFSFSLWQPADGY